MDAGMGIVVAEAEGELENGPPHAGEEAQERRVDISPFWSQRARDEAALRASRPSGLPPVPGTDEKLGEGEALHEEPGLEGGLLGGHDRQNGERSEAGSSQQSEFWSEVRRDLMTELEGARMANGGEGSGPEPGFPQAQEQGAGGHGQKAARRDHGRALQHDHGALQADEGVPQRQRREEGGGPREL